MWKDYPLDPVKDHAREVVEMGLADRVEVRDTNEKLVFQWPLFPCRPLPAFPTDRSWP